MSVRLRSRVSNSRVTLDKKISKKSDTPWTVQKLGLQIRFRQSLGVLVHIGLLIFPLDRIPCRTPVCTSHPSLLFILSSQVPADSSTFRLHRFGVVPYVPGPYPRILVDVTIETHVLSMSPWSRKGLSSSSLRSSVVT